MNALLSLLGLLLTTIPPPPVAHPAAQVDRWPLRPRPSVVRAFDPPAARWTSGHRGVDLLGSPGAPVRAPLPGRISFAGMIAGRGVVVIDHGGRRTTYEPVEPLLARGSAVQIGTVIGELAAGPSHCAPRTCLHWGLIIGTEYADPLTLLGPGPVRLLPFVEADQARGWANR